jgi:hypothetical protein
MPPPSLTTGFLDDLVRRLEEEILSIAPDLGGDSIRVTKWDISAVIKCEGFFTSPDEFIWTARKLRGTVTHRAIQISLTGAGAMLEPMQLVQRVIEGLADVEGDSVSEFLDTADEGTISDIVVASASDLTNFMADWPPIRPGMTPRIESPISVPIVGGQVVLRGKYDLALGRPGKDPVVIVDLKTGLEQSEHRDEARYYALLETLRIGVPPLRVASYYLDSGTFQVQDVNQDVLQAAARRTSAAVGAIASLWRRTREPVLRSGPQCRYCPLRNECDVGIAWLAAQAAG